MSRYTLHDAPDNASLIMRLVNRVFKRAPKLNPDGLSPVHQNPERPAFLKRLFYLANTPHPALRMIFYAAPCLHQCALYPKSLNRSWFRLADMPHLHDLCLSTDAQPCIRAARAAEELGPTPFTAPRLAIPPKGSAT